MKILMVVIALLALSDGAIAASGGVTATVRDPSGVGLPQSAGSNVDCYSQPTLTLTRVSTGYIFADSVVEETTLYGGYTITGYATDWVPKTQTNVVVNRGSTTVVTFLLARPVLDLTLSPTSVSQNGGTSTATLTLRDANGDPVSLRNALTITATSADTTKATVTQPATIAAGATSTTFTVTGVNHGASQASVVTISVTAGTWGADDIGVTVTP
ncbi:MAG TPA: hypothetical protein VEL07_01200 [Planctomycetota bacterium]|nr:hypothetical protein [Planctomycetota bacterium]